MAMKADEGAAEEARQVIALVALRKLLPQVKVLAQRQCAVDVLVRGIEDSCTRYHACDRYRDSARCDLLVKDIEDSCTRYRACVETIGVDNDEGDTPEPPNNDEGDTPEPPRKALKKR